VVWVDEMVTLKKEILNMDKKKIKVLLVDDHQVLSDGLVVLLEADPKISVVGQCENGLDVLPLAMKTRPDVIILDITLPGLNGIDVCRELSEKTPDIAVIILTMHNNEEFTIEALENGASGYLLKDAAADEVILAVHATIRGELFLGGGIDKNVLSKLHKDRSDPYLQLTSRERQVLGLIVEGKTSPQIARELSITPKTVDTHKHHIRKKLDIHTQTELVKYAIRKGITTA
jgi:two-component system response regulator NreC